MLKRSRQLLINGLLSSFAAAGIYAQPKLNAPAQPVAPPKLAIADSATPAPLTVAAGPEPWYTVFGTSEVIGFIEPCG